MKIQKVEWTNYRPYTDHSMSFDEEKPTVVINWVNGVGKTSFLNSIYWCLYGEELFPVRRYIPNGDSVKEALRQGLSVISVRVKVLLRAESGMSIQLVRTQDFKINTQNDVRSIGMSNLEGATSQSDDKGFVPIGDAHNWVSRVFPRRLSPHFFIDGQNLQSLRVQAAPRKEAIASIAAIDALGNQITHLEQIKSELAAEMRTNQRRTTAGAKENAGELQSKIGQLDDLIGTLERQQSQFIEEYGDPSSLEEENLAIKGAEDSMKALIDERNHLRTAAREAQDRVASSLQAMPAVLLLPEISSLIERGESDAFSPLSENQLRAIIENGVCVCGEPLESGNKALTHLKEAIESLKSGPGSAHVDLVALKQLNASALQAKGELKTNWKAFRTSNGQRETLDSQINEFRNQNESLLAPDIRTASAEEILKLIGGYRATESYLNDHRDTRAEHQTKLNELNNQMLEEAIEKDDPRAAIQHEIRFAQHLIDKATFIHDKAMEDVRKKLSDVFEQLFRQMTSDEDGNFERVELDSDLNMKVYDADGQERQSGFSSGWSLVAAFAFAYSLNAIAGFELPLIVDTPFGNLSKERKKLLARTLSEATKVDTFEGRQFIVLVTDTEADHGVAEELSGAHTQWFVGRYDNQTQAIAFESRSD